MMHPRKKGGGTGGSAGRRSKRFYYRRRKVCKFCAEKIDYIDWKDDKLLASFIPERAKIMPRRISGTCAPHQRKLKTAIQRARNIALLPFTF
jgi:small subunit ribosomal protein S18